MKRVLSCILLIFTLFVFGSLKVYATDVNRSSKTKDSSGIEYEYYLIDVTSNDEEECMEVKETFRLRSNPNKLKIRRHIFHNELLYDYDTNVESYKKNGISYYEFDLEIGKEYYITYKIKSSDVKNVGHAAQFYFKTSYAGTRSSKEFSIPNIRLKFNTSDKIGKNNIQIFGGELYRASDEYTSITVTANREDESNENYMYVYYLYSTFPTIKFSDYKVNIKYIKEEERFLIDETFRVEAPATIDRDFTKDLEEEFFFESKNCKLKFGQNPDGSYEYKFTQKGNFKCSMLYEVEKKSSELEEIYFAPFALKPLIKYNITYKDYYLSLDLEDLDEYSFDFEGCDDCRVSKTNGAIVMTTYGTVESIPGIYIKKGSKSIGSISSIFNKDFFDNLLTKSVIALVIFIVNSVIILANDNKGKSKKQIKIVAIITSAIVYIGMSINSWYAALLIPVFYSYFYYNLFFIPRKNGLLDMLFIMVHTLIFTGSFVSPVAFIILNVSLMNIGKFYIKNTVKK